MEGRTWASAVAMSVAVSLRHCAGVADGDTNEVDPSPVTSKRDHQGVVLVRFLLELLVVAEVPAEADLKED